MTWWQIESWDCSWIRWGQRWFKQWSSPHAEQWKAESCVSRCGLLHCSHARGLRRITMEADVLIWRCAHVVVYEMFFCLSACWLCSSPFLKRTACSCQTVSHTQSACKHSDQGSRSFYGSGSLRNGLYTHAHMGKWDSVENNRLRDRKTENVHS